MVQACKSIHVGVDGYALNSTDGYSYISPWVKVVDYDKFSMTVCFVGGSPQGTLFLEQSNDLEADTGAAMGGGGYVPIYPVATGPATSIPRWADPYRGSSFVSDLSNVPAGHGINTLNVNGAANYTLDQWLFGYSFVRVNFAASSNVNSAVTILMSVKG